MSDSLVTNNSTNDPLPCESNELCMLFSWCIPAFDNSLYPYTWHIEQWDRTENPEVDPGQVNTREWTHFGQYLMDEEVERMVERLTQKVRDLYILFKYLGKKM